MIESKVKVGTSIFEPTKKERLYLVVEQGHGFYWRESIVKVMVSVQVMRDRGFVQLSQQLVDIDLDQYNKCLVKNDFDKSDANIEALVLKKITAKPSEFFNLKEADFEIE